MSTSSFKDIEQLFLQVISLPEEKRVAYLVQVDQKKEVIAEVVRLIENQKKANEYLLSLNARKHDLIVENHLEDGFLNRKIGPYKLLKELGRGGMGRVFLTEQPIGDGVRHVALKLLPVRRTTHSMVLRFSQEQKVLGSLNHKNIAQLYEAGYTKEDEPYFVMEYIAGMPITKFCDENEQTIKERLTLFLDVLSAVQHAHRSLVIHRDIKPSNVLVRDDGVVKLLDFGISKVINEESTDQLSDATKTLEQWITPQFAAPEQVKSESITTATDTYQCGVLLYKLLTGRLPYEVKNTTSSYEIVKVICEQPAKLPSVSACLSLGHEVRELQGDLDAVVLKALRKEPADRYRSVEAFADDIRRYLSGRPVLARQGSRSYLARKYIVRNKVSLSIIASLLFVLISVGVFYTIRVSKEQARATLAANKAAEVTAFMLELFRINEIAEPVQKTVEAKELVDRGVKKVDELQDQPELQVQLLNVIGEAYWGMGEGEQTQKTFRRAIDIGSQKLEPWNPHIGVSNNLLAWFFLSIGEDERAIPFFQNCISIYEGLGKTDSFEIAACFGGLGLSRVGEKQYEEAELLLRKSLEMRIALLGEEHRDVAAALSDLSVVLREKGQLEEAEQSLKEAMRMREKLLGKEHIDVAKTAKELAIVSTYKDDYVQAEFYLLKAYDIQVKAQGKDHFSVKATAAQLKNIYETLQMPEKAMAYIN